MSTRNFGAKFTQLLGAAGIIKITPTKEPAKAVLFERGPSPARAIQKVLCAVDRAYESGIEVKPGKYNIALKDEQDRRGIVVSQSTFVDPLGALMLGMVAERDEHSPAINVQKLLEQELGAPFLADTENGKLSCIQAMIAGIDGDPIQRLHDPSWHEAGVMIAKALWP